MNLLAQKIWSNYYYFFYLCCHAGVSTKRRPKVKRRNEDSSPSDASTPKKGKTGFAGKMKTYLWASR